MANTSQKLTAKILSILKKYHVVRAGIFGSYARGEDNTESDLDIVIEFDGRLLDHVNLKHELEEELGQKVDVITLARPAALAGVWWLVS